MPEIKHNFSSGKMNKDFDERLVPNGEYRHAMNVEVSTASDAEIGTVRNIKGNTIIQSFKEGDINLNATEISRIFQNTHCVGSISDEKDDYYYWLVADSEILFKIYDVQGTLGQGQSATITLNTPPTDSNGVIEFKRRDIIFRSQTQNALIEAVFVDIFQRTRKISLDQTSVNTNGDWIRLEHGTAGIGSGMRIRGVRYEPGVNEIIDQVQEGCFVTDVDGDEIRITNHNFWQQIMSGYQPDVLIFERDRVLNFSNNYFVTGINIIDDLLFWTDNFSEPKKISISRSIEGTENHCDNHTKIINPVTDSFQYAKEEHITVIQRAPTMPPTVEYERDGRGGVIGCNIDNFTLPQVGSTVIVDIYDPNLLNIPNYRVNDILLLTDSGTPTLTSYKVKAQVVQEYSTTAFTPPLTNTNAVRMKVKIISEDGTLTIGSTFNIRCILEEIIDPLFQLKFPRFAYRYKYLDGEYSSMSPFTDPVFVPGMYEYNTKEAHNLGMQNNIKSITVKNFNDFKNFPHEVAQVDILYKDESSPNVYSIDSIRPNELGRDGTIDTNNWNENSYKILSENIYAAIPTNQILRLWDNVPRFAKAQEISANRLIYANYVHGYDMENRGEKIKPILDVGFEERIGEWDPAGFAPRGRKSLKTLRTYKLGVTYSDKYGRQTPVFTNSNSSIKIPQAESQNANAIFSSLQNEAPEWSNSFKLYVKETTNEYYNISLDRMYDAGDDCVWLSFPSAETNKITIDDYLILKKKPNSSSSTAAVTEVDGTKFRVLAKENEAPDHIKIKIKLIGTGTGQTDITQLFHPSWSEYHPDEVGVQEIAFDKHYWEVGGNPVDEETLKAKIIKFSDTGTWSSGSGIGQMSQEYEIETISVRMHGTREVYAVRLTEGLSQTDADWISDLNTASFTGDQGTIGMVEGLKIWLYKEDEKILPEYEGRFFVKIKTNNIINDYLKPLLAGEEDTIAASLSCYYMADSWAPMWESGYGGFPIYYKHAGLTLNNTTIDSHTALWDGDTTTPTGGWTTYAAHNHVVSHKQMDWIKMLEFIGKNDSKWFIDQAFFAEAKSVNTVTSSGNNNPNKWEYGMGFGKGIFKIGSDKARMELAFSEIKIDSNATASAAEPSQWSVGTSDNDSHDEQSVIISRLKKNQRFRYVGDPENTIYTIVNVTGPWRRYNHTSYTEAKGWNGPWGTNDSCPFEHNKLKHFDMSEGQFAIMCNFGNPSYMSGSVISQPFWGVTQKNWVWNNFLAPYDQFNATISTPLTAPPVAPTFTPPTAPLGYVHPYFKNYATWPQADPLVNYTHGNSSTQHYNSPGDNHVVFTAPDNRRIYWKIDIEPNPLAPSSSGSTYNPIDAGNSSHNVAAEIQFLETISDFDKDTLSIDPAVFETEPQDNIDLDIYYEASGNIPTYLHSKTNQDFAPVGSIVRSEQKWLQPPHSHIYGTISWSTGDPLIPYNPCPPGAPSTCVDEVIRVKSWSDNTVRLVDWDGNDLEGSYVQLQDGISLDSNNASREVELRFYKPLIDPSDKNPSRLPLNDSWVSAKMDLDSTYDPNGWKGINGKYTLERNIAKNRVGLSWHNCFSFNNGVESDRIRDDFNATQILNGVKASSVTLKEFKEERRRNGLIYSGIYNSISETNNLNQFIMAEKITKDINPEYGSIQKLHTRDTDLVTLCEDKVLKILANKDAVYNADGNPQLVASENVLGQTIPFVGEYGISRNPESFASEAYRAYFTDKQRGTVLRLSRDGLTPVSDYGMKAWFNSNLRIGNRILGSYDSVKREYNVSILTHVPLDDYTPGPIDWSRVPEPNDDVILSLTPSGTSSRLVPPSSPRNPTNRRTASSNGSNRIVSGDESGEGSGSGGSGGSGY